METLAQPDTAATESAPDEPHPEPLADTEDEQPRSEESQEETQTEDADAQPEDARTAEIAELKENISKANAALATMSGRLHSAETKAASIDRFESGLRRLSGRVGDLMEHSLADAPDSEALRLKDQRHKQEDALSVDQSRATRRSNRLNKTVVKELTRLGLDYNDTRLTEARAMWDRADGFFQNNDVDQAMDMLEEAAGIFTEVFDDVRENQTAESAKENRRRQADTARKNGALNVDTGRNVGQGSEGSNERIWAAYGRGEKDMDESVRKAGKALGVL